MSESAESLQPVRIPEGQPVYLQLVRGEKNQVVRMVRLVGLSEEESREGRPDPFKVIDVETGREIKLLQSERLKAYQHPTLQTMHISPPEDLVRGLNISGRIRRRKRKPKSFQSLIETT